MRSFGDSGAWQVHLEDIEEGIIEKAEKFGKEPEPARELIVEPGPEETVPEEAEEKPHKDKKPGALSRIRNFFHMSLELDPEFFEEEEEEVEREEEQVEEQADEQREEPETAEKPQQEEKLKPVAQLEVKEERQEQLEVEAVSQPVQLEVQEEKKAASVETIGGTGCRHRSQKICRKNWKIYQNTAFHTVL